MFIRLFPRKPHDFEWGIKVLWILKPFWLELDKDIEDLGSSSLDGHLKIPSVKIHILHKAKNHKTENHFLQNCRESYVQFSSSNNLSVILLPSDNL